MSLKVLYLDDEVDLCEVFSDTFATSDIEVVTCSDPAVFFDVVEKEKPDLIFIDYRLPNITGLEIAQKLDSKIPKYLISGDMSVDHDHLFLKVFPKPYPVSDIELLLSEALKNKS